jgi:hypothetical protein
MDLTLENGLTLDLSCSYRLASGYRLEEGLGLIAVQPDKNFLDKDLETCLVWLELILRW